MVQEDKGVRSAKILKRERKIKRMISIARFKLESKMKKGERYWEKVEKRSRICGWAEKT